MIKIEQSPDYIRKIVSRKSGRAAIQRFKKAFNLHKQLGGQYLLCPSAIHEDKEHLTMEFAPFNAFSVGNRAFVSSLSMEDKLDIAIKATDALAFLHHNRVV